MPRTVMFNLRMDDVLFDAIDKAAAASGMKRSAWTREVLASVAVGGVTLDQLAVLVEATDVSPHPSRYLPLQGQTGRSERKQSKCRHPLPGIKHYPFTDVCGACGATVKRR